MIAVPFAVAALVGAAAGHWFFAAGCLIFAVAEARFAD